MKSLAVLATCCAALAFARPAAAQQPTPGALAAARELVTLENDSASVYHGFITGLVRTLPATVDTAVVLPVAREWARQYLAWSDLGPEFARVYATTYTEPELRDILAFYHTPTGRKMAATHAGVALRFSAITTQRGTEHLQELLQAMQQATATHDAHPSGS